MAQMIITRKSLSQAPCTAGRIGLAECYNVSYIPAPGSHPHMATVLARSARLSADPAVLAEIRDPQCSLAVWQRGVPADFAPLVEQGAQDDLRFVSDVAGLPDRLLGALPAAGFGGPPALHAALAADAACLAALFCDACDLAAFELRLEVVRGDSCRRFHADYVTARLITTYLGEGTDWLDEADAARLAAGAAPRAIHRLGAGDVGLFKGKLGEGSPAIHRSPPIAETPGAVRLLLVLNPVSRSFVDGA